MATEIIHAIKKAESDAQSAEEQAAAECDRILKAAGEQAARNAEAQLAKAKQEAQALLDDAKRAGEETENGAQSGIASQIESMRRTALTRQDDAVRLILSELV
ncbi:hypothetical protein CAFE_04580 [Caprobacter fermentans]|uniref:V-type ATP synthase subunit H n=1 Tax=Caproicibacter fermentans TaxID=2576756 RepID=A0A6N8HWM1_9FIRM|nr:hypothetical protein [Caproicibacter fermentans]MVB09793.1 hypothetical protein [Caproicibacter fermentans]